jgi:D-gamma-glutamyl-meso-diaminopimelic acid endopeptidase CwlS
LILTIFCFVSILSFSGYLYNNANPANPARAAPKAAPLVPAAPWEVTVGTSVEAGSDRVGAGTGVVSTDEVTSELVGTGTGADDDDVSGAGEDEAVVGAADEAEASELEAAELEAAELEAAELEAAELEAAEEAELEAAELDEVAEDEALDDLLVLPLQVDSNAEMAVELSPLGQIFLRHASTELNSDEQMQSKSCKPSHLEAFSTCETQANKHAGGVATTVEANAAKTDNFKTADCITNV